VNHDIKHGLKINVAKNKVNQW